MRQTRKQSANRKRASKPQAKSGRRIYSLQVFGATVPVIVKALPQGFEGLFDPQTNEIFINESVSEENFYGILYHELIHAIFSRTGLNQAHGMAPDIEEVIAENISTWLRENAEVKLIVCK
jgi:Zn-dependent peptidase ImmA (M78 family)